LDNHERSKIVNKMAREFAIGLQKIGPRYALCV